VSDLNLHDSRINYIGFIDEDYSTRMMIERVSYENDRVHREDVVLVFENVCELEIFVSSKNIIGSSIQNVIVSDAGLSSNGKINMYLYTIEFDIGKISLKSSGFFYKTRS
jgi:hypothetical protein